MTFKSIAILFLTLLIGFVLGVLSAGRLVESRVNNLQQLRESPLKQFVQTLQPDAEQEHQISPVLQKYEEEIKALHQETRLLVRATIDSMLNEIDPMLNEAQKNRITQKRLQSKERESKGLPPLQPWGPPPPPHHAPPTTLTQPAPPPKQPPAQHYNSMLQPATDSLKKAPPTGKPFSRNGFKPPFPPPHHAPPMDSVKWRQHIQQRLQTPPDTATLKQLWQKKRNGIPFTAQDSAQWRAIHRHIRLHKTFGKNDSLPDVKPRRPFNQFPR